MSVLCIELKRICQHDSKHSKVSDSHISIFVRWYVDNYVSQTLNCLLDRKATRAIIPDFINYWHKDGVIPCHTKSAFYEYKIFTNLNLIALNVLIFYIDVDIFHAYFLLQLDKRSLMIVLGQNLHTKPVALGWQLIVILQEFCIFQSQKLIKIN